MKNALQIQGGCRKCEDDEVDEREKKNEKRKKFTHSILRKKNTHTSCTYIEKKRSAGVGEIIQQKTAKHLSQIL